MPTVIEALQKKWGDKKIRTVKEVEETKVVSTGCVALDFAMGTGGLPVGRIVEIFGPPSIGKTSLTYYMIGEQLKKFPDRYAFYVDLEGSFDRRWAQTLVPELEEYGERFQIVKPDPGMESVQFMNDIVRSGAASIVVFDSIGAMLNDSELEENNKGQLAIKVGGQSMLVTHLAKLITVPAEQNDTTVVLVNQIRDNISAVSFGGVHAPGGQAIKHQATMRVQLKPGKGKDGKYRAKIFGEDVEVGFAVYAQVSKNKAAYPHGTGTWNFYNRPLHYLGGTKVELADDGVIGLDRNQEIFDLALTRGIIKASGAYYHHPLFPEDKKGEHKIYTKEALTEFLRDNPDVQDKIRLELMTYANKVSANNGSDSSS